MKIGVFGTGMVGKAIATKLVSLGHEVRMGARAADNAGATAWAAAHGASASNGTFADAAAFGELLFNCTKGDVALKVLELAGVDTLGEKVMVDVSNPLDFSKGMPPTLSIVNDDSLAETIQRAYPKLRVVKALNTVNCDVMVEPSRVPGEHHIFVAGDDAEAKGAVTEVLAAFGWPASSIYDLGGLSAARGMEMYLPLWLRLFGKLGHANFNVRVVHA